MAAKAEPSAMLILDKPRALDRMLYLSDRKGNTVPTEFLLSSPLRWTPTPAGGRALAGEVVLRAPVLEPATEPDAERISIASQA
jgi:hypothetical protein